VIEFSALFVNYNSWRFCVRALESLLEHPPTRADGSAMEFEVVVVDNDSPQRDEENEARLRELLERMHGKLILHDENGGYAKGMNLAYEHASGRYVLVSNPDVTFTAGCISGLLRHLEAHDDVGAVAPQLYVDRGLTCRLPPNILPTIGDLIGTTRVAVSPGYVARYSKKRTVDAMRIWGAVDPVDLPQLSGCCFIMERGVIERIGLFDPQFPLYYEDTDLTMRIFKAGLRVVEVPACKLVHFYDRSGQTNHEEAMRRYWISRRTFYRKWHGPFGGWLFDFTRWLLDTKWMHRLGKRAPQPNLIELPSSFDAPTVPLPRTMDRFLVEVSMDPRFYLAAGTFGEGDTWRVPETLLECFGPITYYFRICDLGGDQPEEVGIYKYQRTDPEHRLRRATAAAEPSEPAKDKV